VLLCGADLDVVAGAGAGAGALRVAGITLDAATNTPCFGAH
jgi:hypothetical protein